MNLSHILTVEQMRKIDQSAIARGTPGIDLMEFAGLACAEVIRAMFDPQVTVVFCGPGNNGGDGFVIARHLESAGWPVRIAFRGATENLKGDAALAAGRWHATSKFDHPEAIEDIDLDDVDLVIDALFGTGLARDVNGPFAYAINAMNESNIPIVAIDIASGIDGDLGTVWGIAVEAEMTIALCARKQGHLLMPGRVHSGETIIVDIGIPEEVIEHVIDESSSVLEENTPNLWEDHFPWPDPMGHKYTRGHLLCISGPAYATGAARLAATAGLRSGAGLVTIAAPHDALAEHAAQITSIMLKSADDASALARLLEDTRLNAVVIGPGCGVGPETKDKVKTILGTARGCVLDADALTSFEDDPQELWGSIKGPTILTPHAGEFERLFGDRSTEQADRRTLLRNAAQISQATVVLKGPDTLIADPTGRTAVSTNAPPWLATAGSGDVLSGIIAALLAQGMPPFEAACAGVWIHGEAANAAGLGLISEDLPFEIPSVLSSLLLGPIEDELQP